MKTLTPATRLRAAREKAGFKTAAEAARRIGVSPVTYTAHENGGREYDRETAILYGNKLGADPAWLLLGIGRTVPLDEPGGHRRIREVSMRNPGADISKLTAGAIAEINGNNIEWMIPAAVFAGASGADADKVVFIEMRGDSMVDPNQPGLPGSIYPGDRVLIDTSDRDPSPPGRFAVFDGVNIVIKFIDVVCEDGQMRARLVSRNPTYPSFEMPLDQLKIVGRVCGRFTLY